MNRIVKVYTGARTKRGAVVNVHFPNREMKSELGAVIALSPAKSLGLVNHSPDGFEWGYNGSGPAQLALALLLDVGAPDEMAMAHYQAFKSHVVSCLNEAWELEDTFIINWLAEASGGQLTLPLVPSQ